MSRNISGVEPARDGPRQLGEAQLASALDRYRELLLHGAGRPTKRARAKTLPARTRRILDQLHAQLADRPQASLARVVHEVASHVLAKRLAIVAEAAEVARGDAQLVDIGHVATAAADDLRLLHGTRRGFVQLDGLQ